jgi:hypothetical protein
MNDVYYFHVDVFERKVLQVIRPAALLFGLPIIIYDDISYDMPWGSCPSPLSGKNSLEGNAPTLSITTKSSLSSMRNVPSPLRGFRGTNSIMFRFSVFGCKIRKKQT